MELGKYKNTEGHELNVVEIDADGKRVRVDYGGGHSHWWDESDYQTWEKLEAPQPQPTEEPKKKGRKPKIK